MNLKYQIFSVIILFSYTLSSLACSMGFTISFEKLSNDSEYQPSAPNDIENYLDNKFGKDRWEHARNILRLDVPHIPENPSIVTIKVGVKNELEFEKYSEIQLYNMESILVINGDKYSREYTPKIYHVDDVSKNDNKAFNFKEITRSESRINNIAKYKLSTNSVPFISTRLNLSNMTSARIFAVFIPSNDKDEIMVIFNDRELPTNTMCRSVYYVKGKWPDGLKPFYEYQ